MINFKNIVEKLTLLNKTISTMESCTGGGVANAITNVEGAGDIIKFSAVTYSNEFKIKMGVDKNIIDEFSVYSMETAKEMSVSISEFSNSNYGIGITGRLNRVDKFNPGGIDNEVFISIYDKDLNKFYTKKLIADKSSRTKNKEYIIDTVINELENILK